MAKSPEKSLDNQTNVSKIALQNTTAGKSKASDPKRNHQSQDNIEKYLTSFVLGTSFAAPITTAAPSTLLRAPITTAAPSTSLPAPSLYFLELKDQGF